MDFKAQMIQRIKNKSGQPLPFQQDVPIITTNEKRPLPKPFEFTRRVSNFATLIKDVKEKRVKFNLKSAPNPECEKLHHNVDAIMEKNKSKLVNAIPIISLHEDDEDAELTFAERQTLWNPKKKKKFQEESNEEEEKEEKKEEEEEEEEQEEIDDVGGLSPGWETDKDLLPREPNFKASKMIRLFESQGISSSALELLTREAQDVEKKLMKDFQDSQECIISSKKLQEQDE